MSEWSEEHLKRAKEGTEYYIEKAILDSKEIGSLKSKLSLSTEREERYRKALEWICHTPSYRLVVAEEMQIIACTALNERKE